MGYFKEDVERLYQEFKEADSINEKNLLTILSDNKDTPFGLEYGFKDIKSIEDYRKVVPLTDYAYYENGNKYVYEVGYHLATSGTLGKQKKFTVSTEAMNRYGGYYFKLPFYLLNMKPEKGINISVFRDVKKETLLSCALYDNLFKNHAFELDDYYDKDFLFSDTYKNIPYIKMYIALAHPDVRYFNAIFIYDLLLVFRYLEDNWKMILNDIKNKTFSVDLSDEEKALLLKTEFSEERIKEIENIFNEGFETPIIPRLFKDIKYVCGVGGGKYAVYDSGLKRYTGDTPIHYFIFAQTECTMAVPLEMNKAEFAMMPRCGFFEYRDLKTNNVLLAKELKIGESYEPIVTTFSGLYRYHTGDSVTLVNYKDQTPVFTIGGRINSIINIAGEKVDDKDIALALNELKAKYEFNQFAIGIDPRVIPNRYVLFLETEKLEETFINEFDDALRKISFDYDDLRKLEAISAPIVVKQTEENFKKIQKGQIKPKVILTSEQTREWINERE